MPDVSDVLTLEQAYALALERNPRLDMFAWDIRAADARILQASLRPNPELAFEAEDLRLFDGPVEITEAARVSLAGIEVERERTDRSPAGLGESELTLYLRQRFELGGKRARRIEAARAGKGVAEWDYEIARLDVLTDVARAYIQTLAAQHRVDVRAQIVDLAAEVARTIGARAEAGKVSPIEAERADVLVATAQVDLDRAQRALAAAKATIGATWAAPNAAIGALAGNLASLEELPALDQLRSLAEENPNIKAWMREIVRREAVVRLERAQRVPDLTVEFGLRSTGARGTGADTFGFGPDGPFFSRSNAHFDRGRDTSLVLGASIDLPIFDRNQGNIDEARAFLDKAHDERRVTVLDVERALAEWYQQARAAREEVERLDAEALPQAQEVFEKTEQGYEAGKFGYLDVLDAQRSLFDLRVRRLEAQAEYQQARVELERLVGEPLPAAPGAAIEEATRLDPAPVDEDRGN